MNRTNSRIRELALPAALFLTTLFALPAAAQPTTAPTRTPTRTAPTRDIYVKGRFALKGVKQVFSVLPGNAITLSVNDGTLNTTTGKYEFDLSYTAVNGGNAATGPFNNRVVDDGVGMAGVTGITLNAGEAKVITHKNVAFDLGSNEVKVLLDDANQVAETDEGNNSPTVKITIQ